MVPLIIFGTIVVAFVLAGIYGHRLERTRTETLRDTVAPQMGLDFAPTDETGIQSGFAGFNLFSHGRGKTVKNIVYGRLAADVEVIVFDYQYTTGSGKNRTTTHQTVGFFQSDALRLPEFVARPEGVFDKIGQVFGMQDIDLPMHPAFSKRYLLRGTDEPGIRDFFTPGVARFFEDGTGMSIEAKPDRFILYRRGKRLKPEEWRGWVDKGLAACELFRGRASV